MIKILCFDVSYENKSIHLKTEAKHYKAEMFCNVSGSCLNSL